VAQLASVLVIAADPNIESLVSELTVFAGFRPIPDPTGGAAGESVRLERPDAVLLDTAVPWSILRACIDAAEEARSALVLMSSTASASELAASARGAHCGYFILPGGPRALADVMRDALEGRRQQTMLPIPRRLREDEHARSLHPAMCAALSGVARSYLLRARAVEALRTSRMLRGIRDEVLDDARRSRSALRAVVSDYILILKSEHIPEADAIVRLRGMISDCSSLMGTESVMPTLLMESEHWAREVYTA